MLASADIESLDLKEAGSNVGPTGDGGDERLTVAEHRQRRTSRFERRALDLRRSVEVDPKVAGAEQGHVAHGSPSGTNSIRARAASPS